METLRAPHLTTSIARFRQLLWSLALRDLRVRYKQSMLGLCWAVLVPLSMMLIFTFVFTRTAAASVVPDVNMPYALYAYVGLLPWTFFAASLNGSVNSLVANRNLVTKVYFPREVLPFSAVLGALVDFAVAGFVLLGLMLYFHATGQWQFQLHAAWTLVPLIIAAQLMLTLGTGLVLAMANLFYRDVRQVFTLVIQLGMFVSGVVVPIPSDGSWIGTLLGLNPMAAFIDAYRDCIIHGRLPVAAPFATAVIVSVFVLVAGWTVFRRSAWRFAESI